MSLSFYSVDFCDSKFSYLMGNENFYETFDIEPEAI